MNFLDTYGLTGMGANTPPVNTHPEQSLNDEVSQVIGQLGKFWGGFRKQSETALATARKDFGEVVTQAQKELGKLTISTETPADSDAHVGEAEDKESENESECTTAPETPTAESHSAAGSLSTSQSIFARLQSSLPPNIVSTVQAQLPESLKHPQNIDLSQLRSTLTTEFQRVQGVTRAQAEEYVHKSEHLLREAMKEASEALRDAVKVIPPEESGGYSNQGLFWDGSDVWMLPMEGGDVKGKGKETDLGVSSGRQSEDAHQAVATRAQALLKQLKSNPEIIKLDPEADAASKTFHAWVSEAQSKDEHPGTIFWSERITRTISDPDDGQTLQETFDVLVPSILSDDQFWTRYFFRVYQIEQEEMRRKALIHGANQTEEDFSWEDDDEESVSPESKSLGALESSMISQRTLAPKAGDTSDVQSLPNSSQFNTPMTMSPRDSEDSYDVISGNVSAAGDAQEHVQTNEEEEEESDWE